ncbi:hypothetical protein HZS_6895 [Henneguya salminicola]|nr:hypothetical protein HZS_6895 [Henneguya salminicola]
MKVLATAYCWLAGLKNGRIETAMGISNGTPEFTKICVLDFNDIIIEGDGIIVEIVEEKLGKRHRVFSVWIRGRVARTPERRLLLVEVPDRTAGTLTRIPQTHYLIQSQSILHDHFAVNPFENFINSNSVVCANTVEGTLNSLKYKISSRNLTNSLMKIEIL